MTVARIHPKVSRTVLVVDDDEDILLLVRTVLERAGYEVRTAPTGHGGLETARQGGIDVMLLDIHIPDLDAWTFLIRAWEERDVGRIPVVMFSASDDVVSVDRARAWGCADFLAKPFSAGQLLDVIGSVLNRTP